MKPRFTDLYTQLRNANSTSKTELDMTTRDFLVYLLRQGDLQKALELAKDYDVSPEQLAALESSWEAYQITSEALLKWIEDDMSVEVAARARELYERSFQIDITL